MTHADELPIWSAAVQDFGFLEKPTLLQPLW